MKARLLDLHLNVSVSCDDQIDKFEIFVFNTASMFLTTTVKTLRIIVYLKQSQLMALDMAHQSADRQLLFLSDSLSSLQSLKNRGLSHRSLLTFYVECISYYHVVHK